MTPRELVSCECGARVSAEKAKIADNGSYHCEICQTKDVKQFKLSLEKQRRRYHTTKRLMRLRTFFAVLLFLNVIALAINIALDITLRVPMNYWSLVGGFMCATGHIAVQERIIILMK